MNNWRQSSVIAHWSLPIDHCLFTGSGVQSSPAESDGHRRSRGDGDSEDGQSEQEELNIFPLIPFFSTVTSPLVEDDVEGFFGEWPHPQETTENRMATVRAKSFNPQNLSTHRISPVQSTQVKL
jgi:hypothetical protein